MSNEPVVTLAGNLTADPELRFLSSGAALCSFTVACTPRAYDKQTGEWKDGQALFMRCSVWRRQAENVAESITRGTRVIVTGRLKQRDFQTKEGEKRSVMELDVEELGISLLLNSGRSLRSERGSNASSKGSNASDPWAPASGDSTEPPF